MEMCGSVVRKRKRKKTKKGKTRIFRSHKRVILVCEIWSCGSFFVGRMAKRSWWGRKWWRIELCFVL